MILMIEIWKKQSWSEDDTGDKDSKKKSQCEDVTGYKEILIPKNKY